MVLISSCATKPNNSHCNALFQWTVKLSNIC